MAHADEDKISEMLDRLDESLGESAHDYDITVMFEGEEMQVSIRPRAEGTTH